VLNNNKVHITYIKFIHNRNSKHFWLNTCDIYEGKEVPVTYENNGLYQYMQWIYVYNESQSSAMYLSSIVNSHSNSFLETTSTTQWLPLWFLLNSKLKWTKLLNKSNAHFSPLRWVYKRSKCYSYCGRCENVIWDALCCFCISWCVLQ